ncbi:hypothetical protein IDH20_04805, partial [Pelagibacterales bacterium SAG-MED39]|nr:hypothetical protein [Pelagibacterales bacterium SAG-MED39]
KVFIKNNILTPKYILYSFNKDKKKLINLIKNTLEFPVVIKPLNEGSSVNVFICTKHNVIKKIKLLENYKKIIIEKFIPGREIQAAVIGSKKLGAIELKPRRKFDAVRRCPDRGFDCDKMAKERIKHFVSKEALNIEGFGKKIVENFWSLNLIRLPQDIFKLDYAKIENLEGWGKQSATNLKYSIDLRKKISFEKFIYSLGIRHIGLENAKLISRNLRSLKNFMSLPKKNNFTDLLNIDGMGETQVNSIKNFFLNDSNKKVLNELEKAIVVKDAKIITTGGLLNNKTFMLTGKLEGISRAEAKSLIEENSGSILSNISKKLDYLIIGEKPTKRKVTEAKNLKIKIINQDEWLKMLNKTS